MATDSEKVPTANVQTLKTAIDTLTCRKPPAKCHFLIWLRSVVLPSALFVVFHAKHLKLLFAPSQWNQARNEVAV